MKFIKQIFIGINALIKNMLINWGVKVYTPKLSHSDLMILNEIYKKINIIRMHHYQEPSRIEFEGDGLLFYERVRNHFIHANKHERNLIEQYLEIDYEDKGFHRFMVNRKNPETALVPFYNANRFRNEVRVILEGSRFKWVKEEVGLDETPILKRVIMNDLTDPVTLIVPVQN